MTNTLFQGWTDHQIRAAFTLANAELAARQQIGCDAQFWQDAAYIAKLTGGTPPSSATH